jgi:ankyrin repeat protein
MRLALFATAAAALGSSALAQTGDGRVHAFDQGDDNRCAELGAAAISNDVASIEDILIQGADIDCRDPLTGNGTPLIKAAGGASFDATKVLIERGAAINLKDDQGHTALRVAQLKRDQMAKLATLPMIVDRLDKIITLLGTKGATP